MVQIRTYIWSLYENWPGHKKWVTLWRLKSCMPSWVNMQICYVIDGFFNVLNHYKSTWTPLSKVSSIGGQHIEKGVYGWHKSQKDWPHAIQFLRVWVRVPKQRLHMVHFITCQLSLMMYVIKALRLHPHWQSKSLEFLLVSILNTFDNMGAHLVVVWPSLGGGILFSGIEGLLQHVGPMCLDIDIVENIEPESH